MFMAYGRYSINDSSSTLAALLSEMLVNQNLTSQGHTLPGNLQRQLKSSISRRD